MKRLGIALVLTCALTVSASAGDIPTIGVASPPPPPPGDVSTTGVVSLPPSVETQSSITTILLTLLDLIR